MTTKSAQLDKPQHIASEDERKESHTTENATTADTNHAETCVICLSPLSERAVAYPCNHLSFDFTCLASWLGQRATCPLCTTPVQRVEYDWRSPTDHKTFHVPGKALPPIDTPTQRHPHFPRRQRRNHLRHFSPPPAPTADEALERRRLVHSKQAFSLHRAPSRAQQPVTPSLFRSSSQLQRKARLFLRRELRVFTFLSGTPSRAEFVLEYIVGMLCRLEIKGSDGAFEDLVAEVLGRDGARLLIHEMAAWLACSFERLEEWDRVVQYADAEIMSFGSAGDGRGQQGRKEHAGQ